MEPDNLQHLLPNNLRLPLDGSLPSPPLPPSRIHRHRSLVSLRPIPGPNPHKHPPEERKPRINGKKPSSSKSHNLGL